MGLDNREQERKNKVITQVSFGGFAGDVSAKDLTDFLARTIGMVWRCRLKTSWTPPDSHLIFDVANTSKNQITDDYKKVEPHAFVHFALERAAKKALKLAGRSELVFNGCALKACVGTDSSYRINTRMKTLPLRFPNATVEIGLMYGRNDFWVGWKGPDRGIDFELDPFDGCCRFSFTRDAMFSIKDSNRHAGIKCDFKVEFLVREIRGVSFYTDTAPFSMVMHLGSPPWIYYRTADDDIFILDGVTFPLLDDEDCWIRTTDFTDSRAISRCNTYRVSFPPRLQHTMEKVMDYLKERRILEEQPNHPLKIRWEPGFGETMKDFFFCLQHKEGISFELLFLVNCLVHNGIVNQHQLSEEFFDLLRSQTEIVNTAAIRHMYSYKRPVFNACRRLKTVQEWLLKTPSALKIPKVSDDYVEVRKVVITPTRAYCLPPEVELSNRVLRRYKHVADRFLRVTFMDEGFQKLNNNALSFYGPLVMKDTGPNSSNKQRTNIFTRVKMMLEKGFSICGRKYTFLAFSSNQLRDSSAWFFAEEAKITVPSIIKWMGKFDNKIVAKCAARMGQCFSSSYATINVPTEEAKEILDIKRNGHTFSDGIGMITPELAMEVAEKLQLTVNPPSGYQIRYAGCKGVLASWPGIGDGKIKLFWRDSMSKFKSTHTMLEICSWTRFQPGFLNRQIITLLSSLGVQDGVFSKMQNSMIFKLNQMLEDTDVAFEVLTTSCSAQGNTAAIMLSAGFMPHSEPHLRGLLSSIRLGQLGDLLAKSRIFVPQSRWLIGVMDESGKLEYGQCFIQVSIPSLECCFHRHGSRFSGTKKNIKVITGTVAIAKNPCLHPGDIRILEAVDAPDLHHLVDCLVFPQKGDRPHANEASGSDLDGDIYFVTWDDSLIPPSRVSETPMDYTPAEARFLPRTVELKAWIYEHFPMERPAPDLKYNPAHPRAMRWRSTASSISAAQAPNRLKHIRHLLDTLIKENVTWDPYKDDRERHPFQQISWYSGCIRFNDVVEQYHPARCLRQFGHVQISPWLQVPIEPIKVKRGASAHSYFAQYPFMVHAWTAWVDHCLSSSSRGDACDPLTPWMCADGYEAWFAERSHVRIDRIQHQSTSSTSAPSIQRPIGDAYIDLDIITFFTKNIVNDSLGKICNAHVVHADLCETGAQDEKCKKLAELAAKAVDFPKTGAVITMDPELKPKVYPDFMGKDDFMSYKSDKILGKLYRDVKYISEDQKSETEELTSEEIPYDLDLEIPGSEDFISEAWNNKCIYDRQIDALLGQYKVSTESEVVTGHVWSMPKLQSRKLGDIKERLINAYSALKKEFRRAFENLSLSSQELTEDERNELYEQKASAWYQVTYHPRWVKKAEELRDLDGDGGSVRLSFAWITADYLARIKIRRRDRDGISKFKPIDSLAGYLVNKI